MALVHELVSRNLPIKRRVGSKGWITFNAVCCHHRGHNQDKRFRGNVLFTPEGVVVYNCYNCGFKTRYDGTKLSRNFESFMVWLGVPSDEIKRAKMETINSAINGSSASATSIGIGIMGDFKECPLPEHAIPFDSLVTEEELPEYFLEAATYLASRGDAVLGGWNYHWSPSTKKDMNRRIIIPFYHRHKVVGWTARYVGKAPEGTPRYYNSDLQPGYIFNCDAMEKHGRRYVTVHEGPFDAISVDGVAMLGSELSREQVSWLNSCDMEKIVVPDRQKGNQGLIDAALENGWYVSFPEWEEDVKDSADASCRYGRLFTLSSIIRAMTRNSLEIGIKRKMFR